MNIKIHEVNRKDLIFPEYSDWECHLFGNVYNSNGIVFRPLKGKEPNWFWRYMQYLCFGNIWKKKK